MHLLSWGVVRPVAIRLLLGRGEISVFRCCALRNSQKVCVAAWPKFALASIPSSAINLPQMLVLELKLEPIGTLYIRATLCFRAQWPLPLRWARPTGVWAFNAHEFPKVKKSATRHPPHLLTVATPSPFSSRPAKAPPVPIETNFREPSLHASYLGASSSRRRYRPFECGICMKYEDSRHSGDGPPLCGCWSNQRLFSWAKSAVFAAQWALYASSFALLLRGVVRKKSPPCPPQPANKFFTSGATDDQCRA